jgi:pimeloyl-ACP methyl ester carboxylesterase
MGSKRWFTRHHDKRSFAKAAGLAAAALAAAAVAATTVLTGTADATASGQAGPPVPVLHWHSCHGGFTCATARVPVDYRYPRGKTISLAVIMHRATDGSRRAQKLFINAGGPSEQIVPFLEGDFAAIPAVLRQRFDIITFDPRGFGFSTAVRCFPTAAAENKFLAELPPFPVGASQDAAWEQTYARLDALCATRGGSLIKHDTTADVARDMNLLREAVHARTLNYIGLSYGTGLGATYANLFPGSVGHMVLDGNLDPVSWTSGGRLPSGLRRGADLATEATMRSFLDLCGKVKTSACAFSAGTPPATRAKWQALLDRLLAHPVKLGTQTVTYADAVTSVPLGTVSQWQAGAALLQLIWTASAGNHVVHATPGTEATSGGSTTPNVYAGVEQSYAVVCADSADPRQAGAYQAAARLAYARSGPWGLYWAWSEEVCARWPQAAGQDRYTGPWNRRTASTILVVGLTGDPATPYADSVAMAHDLARARLLTVHGYGHTEAANPSTCATSDLIRYLITGALPKAGAVCKQNGTPF